MTTAHETLVVAQFGANARAYVESADHATGADLIRLGEVLAARAGCRALDLGCGGGHVSFTAAAHAGEVVAYDLSTEMLAAVRAEATRRGFANIRTEQGTAESLPFADGAFDVVLTRFSAHHWYDVAAGLREMRRVIAPDGLAVVMDAVSPGRPALHDTYLQTVEMLRDPSHIRDYSEREWCDALHDVGFRPSVLQRGRLPLDFARWIERIGTPDDEARAIRALQARMPPDVREHFAIAADGSFTLDTIMIEAVPV